MVPKVEFRKVQKTYNGRTMVIRDLDLTIQPGEFLTLLGPSGSGKTTTLMMLAGFEVPTGGEILLDGRSLEKLPPHRRNFGMVFQNYALFPHMTVAENLAFPLRVRYASRDEVKKRTTRALELVKLSGFEDRKPDQLSGGQQQRVALARALIFDPTVVLMDEPLGALDKQLREELQIEIRRIQRELRVTLVYVTHDQAEALTMSDRIAVFNGGEVRQIAVPEELYERPMDAFVAQFVGENNRMTGIVAESRKDECLVVLGDGSRIRATPIGSHQAGAKVVLSVRPERVVLSPSGDIANVFDGRIEEVVFVGEYLRVRLATSYTGDLIVKVPNGAGRPSLAIGEHVKVGWSFEDCRALAHGAG